ncbi:chorismate mutase [Krasilnikoviella flava]|uniref:Chorismate mutase n=1 Tax=Krasilnikoviella flava TaxID=526729 RepID=A0A1T5LQR5_9MICO|nr:chorismate mutase [Krasilnikoviella flava]SKC78225.1 chorismate mutase [Krasilnikoviella flava]
MPDTPHDPAARPAGPPVTDGMPQEILELRASIDNIDAALVHLLAERFKMTRRVGELKAVGGLPPGDPSRDRQQVDRLKGLAESAGLDPEFTEQFRNFIVSEVIRHHERIAAEHAAGRLKGELPPLDTYA